MKFLKSKKSVLIALVMVVSFLLLFSQTAFAQNGVQLSAGDVSGSVGDEVTVQISISNAMDTEGGQFDLHFDSSIAEPVSAARGAFVPDVSGNLFDSNLALADGELRVLWVIAEGSDQDSGVVGTITFEIVGEGETDLDFSAVVIAPEGVEVGTHVSGSITGLDADALLAAAIAAADAAIEALPDPDDITLDDEDAVKAARALVDAAKALGAEDDDFEDLEKLVAAEEMIAKLKAIKAACDAIYALPAVKDLTLDDKPDVVAARALVNKAKADHGAVDADFSDCLSILVAAENRIKELEGLKPTPPTGGMNYLLLSGMLAMTAGFLLHGRRKLFSAK